MPKNLKRGRQVVFGPDVLEPEHIERHRPGKHVTYSDKECRIRSYVIGRLMHKLDETLAKELARYTQEEKASILSVCHNAPFIWAASNGDVNAMRFIVAQMPDSSRSKLIQALIYNHHEAIRKFVQYCIDNDLTSDATKALLDEGVQIFVSINEEVAVSTIQSISEEYDGKVQELLLAALPAASEESMSVSSEDIGPTAVVDYPSALLGLAIRGSGGILFRPPSGDPDDLSGGGVNVGGQISSGAGAALPGTGNETQSWDYDEHGA